MAAGATYVPLATQTLTSSAATVTFNSISGAYTDLVAIVQAFTGHSGAQQMYIQLNSDATEKYSWTRLLGDGSTASTDSASSVQDGSAGALVNNSSNMGINIFNIMNYSNTTTRKTVLYRSNITGTQTVIGATLYRSTSAITSLRFAVPNSTYSAGSIFTIYGIAAA